MVMHTMRTGLIVLAAALVLAPIAARAATVDDPTNIMRPERGSRAAAFEAWHQKHPNVPRRTSRGSSNPVYPAALPKPDHFVPSPSLSAQPNNRVVEPYLASPQTGRALPNLDQGRRETGQDRALRCAHQAGAYGETGGSYLGTCINQ